jgi:hypothetical protein
MIEQSNNWPDRSRPEPMPETAFGRPEVMRQTAQIAKQSADPWVHRSSGMKCRTCIWFVGKEPQALTVTVKSHEVGRCRRHAPTMGGYPVVYMTDWCGDHRIDENKI